MDAAAGSDGEKLRAGRVRKAADRRDERKRSHLNSMVRGDEDEQMWREEQKDDRAERAEARDEEKERQWDEVTERKDQRRGKEDGGGRDGRGEDRRGTEQDRSRWSERMTDGSWT